jgi:hypothetical protein
MRLRWPPLFRTKNRPKSTALKPYEKLQRYWRDTNAGIDTVVLSSQSIDDLERKYGIRLPDDFRDSFIPAPEATTSTTV